MSIVAENENLNALSGKYSFHSWKNNRPAFIREGGELPQVKGENHFLAYYDVWKTWYIQNDFRFSGIKNPVGGFFRIATTGMF